MPAWSPSSVTSRRPTTCSTLPASMPRFPKGRAHRRVSTSSESCAGRRARGVRTISLARVRRRRCAGVRRQLSRRDARRVRDDGDHQLRAAKILSAEGGGAVFTDDADSAPLRERPSCPVAANPAPRGAETAGCTNMSTRRPDRIFPPRAVQIRLARASSSRCRFVRSSHVKRARLRASARLDGTWTSEIITPLSIERCSPARRGPSRSARGRRLLPLHRAPRGRRQLAHSARAHPARYLGKRALSRAARVVRGVPTPPGGRERRAATPEPPRRATVRCR